MRDFMNIAQFAVVFVGIASLVGWWVYLSDYLDKEIEKIDAEVDEFIERLDWKS